MDAKILEVWQCDKCDKIYKHQDFAEKCCKEINIKKCADCGKQLPKKYYSYVCDECKEKRIFDNARQMTYSEYVKEFPNHMISNGYNYWANIEEYKTYVKEYNVHHFPKYLFGTKIIYSQVDVRYELKLSIDNMGSDVDDHNTEYYSDEIQKLMDFMDEWNEKDSQLVFTVDMKVVIML